MFICAMIHLHTNIWQFIWFLAPTVALCAQQFEYLQSQITFVHMKYLSGADEVERWTEQSLWDAVLKDCKVVVSTYQILLDALTHGFVKMESLALIVFDEGLLLYIFRVGYIADHCSS